MAFHIVIIEDDPTIQELYRLLFENEGYHVTLFPYLDQDSMAANSPHPDLIILDVLINGKQNGWSFLQTLKQDPQKATVPVLVVTALSTSTFEDEGKKYIQGHAIPVIFKPFDIDALLVTVQSLLSRTSQSNSSAPA